MEYNLIDLLKNKDATIRKQADALITNGFPANSKWKILLIQVIED